MKEKNQMAIEMYHEYQHKLNNLINSHWQLSQIHGEDFRLITLSLAIRKTAALMVLWKEVAYYNTSQRESK